jgi:hypothetical protein
MSVKARHRQGWQKIRKSWPGIWRHESGWTVHHCGHPTALWPYYAQPPGGGPMLLASNGHGFRLLALAQEAVESKAKEQACAK